jgi:hypothetical protein
MPALCDPNRLLALCYDRHAHHRGALTWLDGQDRRGAALRRSTQPRVSAIFQTTGSAAALASLHDRRHAEKRPAQTHRNEWRNVSI